MSRNQLTTNSGNATLETSSDMGNSQFVHNHVIPNKPIGVTLFGSFYHFSSQSSKRTYHKALVLCITFIAYTCFHMGRRPLSIVKNVLNRNCTDVDHVTFIDSSEEKTYVKYEIPSESTNNSTWCDWAPFNDNATANQLLALLDSAFLFSYAIFMFFSGFLADRCNLRYYLSGGMILSGLLLYAFGLSYYLNIHSMSYFIVVQILSGIIQTTGWPSVVTCIGNWFDQSSRGSIFGLWNSNTNLGNILGATIAGYFVERSWGLSFIVPGFIMLVSGVITFLFLVPKPEDVGLLPIKSIAELKTDGVSSHLSHRDWDVEEAIDQTNQYCTVRRSTSRRKFNNSCTINEVDSALETDESQTVDNGEHSPLISNDNSDAGDEIVVESSTQGHAVSFWTCIRIPGVLEYSLSLGFAKLVSYTFLYWLPRYITQSTLNNSEDSAYLSTPFDVGGMLGAIIAGFLSDRYKKSATICTVMLILSIPAMLVYEKFAAISNLYNVGLQLVTGTLVTGPYALITTAVSTDLGSRIKDGKAMATTAAIIDGTGSIGAAVGPLFAGYISDSGWETVFLVLMVSNLMASFCITRITLKENGFGLTTR